VKRKRGGRLEVGAGSPLPLAGQEEEPVLFLRVALRPRGRGLRCTHSYIPRPRWGRKRGRGGLGGGARLGTRVVFGHWGRPLSWRVHGAHSRGNPVPGSGLGAEERGDLSLERGFALEGREREPRRFLVSNRSERGRRLDENSSWRVPTRPRPYLFPSRTGLSRSTPGGFALD
jgi:hypothetical protein